jgi:hypothetical protein
VGLIVFLGPFAGYSSEQQRCSEEEGNFSDGTVLNDLQLTCDCDLGSGDRGWSGVDVGRRNAVHVGERCAEGRRA